MRALAPVSAAVLLLGSSAAFAESGFVNIHVEPGAAFAIPETGYQGVSFAGALKLDVPVARPLAVQAQGFTLTVPRGVRTTNLYGAGLGVRVRLLDDHGGFRFRPAGNTKGGNWFGNLWFDGGLLLTGTNALNSFGLDVGLGVESSVFEGLQIGPFVKFSYVDSLPVATVGVSFSIGGDAEQEGPPDLDKDGVIDPLDKCPNQPEDKDGFKDEDGCPDPDNDNDNLVDDRDKCPLKAEDLDGVDDDDGCPEDETAADRAAKEKAQSQEQTPTPDAQTPPTNDAQTPAPDGGAKTP